MDYKNVCVNAVNDDAVFNTFKTHVDYREILEHVSYEQGLEYLDVLKCRGYRPADIHTAQIHNTIGGPKLFDYGEYGKLSPTTLRYFKVMSDIEDVMDLRNARIAEIGVGYGGQFALLNKKWGCSADLYDLPEVLALTDKYLQRCGVSNYNLMESIESSCTYDLVISNYAFSELHSILQNKYLINILSRSVHGYLTCNFCGNELPHWPLSKYRETLSHNKNFNIVDEFPLTYKDNKIITW